jgi:hypothetical protein
VGGPLITATASHVSRPTPTRPPVGGGPAARPIRQNILDGHAPARDIRLSLALARLSDAEAGVIHAFTLPPPWTAVKVLHQARGGDRKREHTSFTELGTPQKSCTPFPFVARVFPGDKSRWHQQFGRRERVRQGAAVAEGGIGPQRWKRRAWAQLLGRQTFTAQARFLEFRGISRKRVWFPRNTCVCPFIPGNAQDAGSTSRGQPCPPATPGGSRSYYPKTRSGQFSLRCKFGAPRHSLR